MKNLKHVSFTYALAKQEIDEAIAAALPNLLENGNISKDDVLELFGPRPLELANISYHQSDQLFQAAG